MKKTISILLLLALLSTFFVPASAASIKRSSTWFCLRCGNIGTGNRCSSCHCSRPTGITGSIVTFGSYEQDSRGKKPIEWIVLDTSGNSALLLSRYILDFRAYDSTSREITWKTSSIRSWLNGSFLKNAFQESERSKIQKTYVDNSFRQARYSYVDEEDTVDSIFLLSCTEAFQYLGLDFGDQYSRFEVAAARMTDYARKRSERYTATGAQYGEWWLRSMRSIYYYDDEYYDDEYNGPEVQTFMVQGGCAGMYYSPVHYKLGIRPAMWVRT